MLLQAILVSRDLGSTALISSAFRGAVVDVRVISNADEVLHAITATKFDAIIVDYESVPEARGILADLRKSRSNQRAIAFALVASNADHRDVLQDGANFILEKPLNAERLTLALRAAHSMMVNERRRYLRHRIKASCWMKSPYAEFQIGMVNVSDGGIGIDMSDVPALELEGDLRFRFQLPESDQPIDGKGEIAWTREGRAGIRFTALTTSSREELSRWLSRRFEVVAAQAVGGGASAPSVH